MFFIWKWPRQSWLGANLTFVLFVLLKLIGVNLDFMVLSRTYIPRFIDLLGPTEVKESKWNFQESKSYNQGSKILCYYGKMRLKNNFPFIMFHFYAHLYKWDKKIPILRSDFLGIEWTDDFWFVTQLANHNFMNEQQQQKYTKTIF